MVAIGFFIMLVTCEWSFSLGKAHHLFTSHWSKVKLTAHVYRATELGSQPKLDHLDHMIKVQLI